MRSLGGTNDEMLAKDTPVDRADVHGDIERARTIWHLCSCTCPPGRRQE